MRTPTSACALLLAVVLAPGCDASLVVSRGGGSSSLGQGADAGAALGDAGTGSDDVRLSSSAIRDETCGNETDDDDNGLIDDGCECVEGTERPCWIGTPTSRGVGVCVDGVQRCEPDGDRATWGACVGQRLPTEEVIENELDDDCDGQVDESVGVCVPTTEWEGGESCHDGRDNDCDGVPDCQDPDCAGVGACTPACETSETLCWGGLDDDCDGAVDCDDPDCADAPQCTFTVCPEGKTPTYRDRQLPADWGPSSISEGDGEPIMPMTCEDGGCPAGQVAIVLPAFRLLPEGAYEIDGTHSICVPPPPECPAGQSPNYVGGAWRCDGPCDLVVHYGAIFGGKRRCAPTPDLDCPIFGTVPTFVFETEQWECRGECDDGLYDRHRLDGELVCVPC